MLYTLTPSICRMNQRAERLEQLLIQEQYVPDFNKTIRRVSYQDGVKFYFPDDTWVSIRFSGTEPVLRIFLEANDAAEAKQFKDVVLNDTRLNLNTPQEAFV